MTHLVAQGQAKEVDLKDHAPITLDDLKKLLVPQYLQNIPEKDGWGHPYEYYLKVGQRVLDPQVMFIRSPGRDGKYESSRYSVAGFPPDSFDEDIVWTDGFFARWPEGSTPGH